MEWHSFCHGFQIRASLLASLGTFKSPTGCSKFQIVNNWWCMPSDSCLIACFSARALLSSYRNPTGCSIHTWHAEMASSLMAMLCIRFVASLSTNRSPTGCHAVLCVLGGIDNYIIWIGAVEWHSFCHKFQVRASLLASLGTFKSPTGCSKFQIVNNWWCMPSDSCLIACFSARALLSSYRNPTGCSIHTWHAEMASSLMAMLCIRFVASLSTNRSPTGCFTFLYLNIIIMAIYLHIRAFICCSYICIIMLQHQYECILW